MALRARYGISWNQSPEQALGGSAVRRLAAGQHETEPSAKSVGWERSHCASLGEEPASIAMNPTGREP